MRFWTMILFCLACSMIDAETILRHFTPGNEGYLYPDAYDQYVNRYELNTAFEIRSIRVKCAGTASSSAKISIYGHEAGTSFPQIEQSVIDPITINKSTAGDEWIEVNLETGLNMRGNQFFVVLHDFQNGFRIYADNELRHADCKSSNGGDFYYSWLKNRSGQWSIGIRKSFAIEVIGNADVVDKPFLEEQTVHLGIDPTLSNATMAVADINGDLYPEILVAGRLYINNKGISFTLDSLSYEFPGTPRTNSLVDMDNDGDLDMMFFDVGNESFAFENVDGKFTRHNLDLPDLNSINSASYADLDKDGLPEIFVSQLWGTYPVPKPNYLFKNNGDFTFTDISNKLYPNHDGNYNYANKLACDPGNQGTWQPNNNRNKRSRGSRFIDFDNDGDLDLYVVNYFLEQDELYQNNGDGTFTEVCATKNIDRNKTGSNHGTGVDWADFDADGDFDLLLAQFAHPGFAKQYDHRATTVYENNDGAFTDLNPDNELIDPPSGIDFEETYAGAAWGDFNNDGYDDFINTVYYGCRYIKVFRNNGDKTFTNVSHESGLSAINSGQDAVWADLNLDGKLDLLTGEGNRIRVWMNRGETGNYIKFHLYPRGGSNRKGIGTKITITTDDMNKVSDVVAGRGQRMQKPYLVHVGVGENKILNEVTIDWPSGNTNIHRNLPVNQIIKIIEGEEIINAIESSIRAFPNPADGVTTIEVTSTSEGVIGIYNSVGQLVDEIRLEKSGIQEINYNTNQLLNGLYFLRFDDQVTRLQVF